MKKVFLSPSDQTRNTYAYGNTNEAVQCLKIAEACKAALERSGVVVNTLKRYGSLSAICAASDAFGPDLHVPIHTNAYNGKVSGTRLFCVDLTGAGYKACKAIMSTLAPVTPGNSDSVRTANFYEILYPKAPTAYIEVDFHDVPEIAKWLVEHTVESGEAIAKGICSYLGVTYVAPDRTPGPTTKTIYRVQVGAFEKKANAENLKKELDAAGYNCYIVKTVVTR